ncbi:MAG: hypothetical protein RR212_02200 [Bacteroidales bacterium]
MIKKTCYIIFFFLIYLISGYYKNEERQIAFLQNLSVEEESGFNSSNHFSYPDSTEEILYSYQNTLFNLPLLPRLKTNTTSFRLLSGGPLLNLNKLLLKDGFICQSSPKRPYLLQPLSGNPHPGAPKAYYVYALRRLII